MSEQLFREHFKLEEFLPLQIMATASRVKDFLAGEIAEELNLSLAEWRLLVVVGALGSASPSDVVERSGMHKVKVSLASATLIARGVILQKTAPDDGRARVMLLTRKGTRTYQDAVSLGRRIEERIGSRWDGLRRALVRLDSVLDEEEGGEGED